MSFRLVPTELDCESVLEALDRAHGILLLHANLGCQRYRVRQRCAYGLFVQRRRPDKDLRQKGLNAFQFND